jgi:hypothetical protein
MTPAMMHTHMQRMHNSIVSDRIAVFSKANNYPIQLDVTALNHDQYNYSTCILVLALKNSMWWYSLLSVASGLDLESDLLCMTVEHVLEAFLSISEYGKDEDIWEL